MKREEKKIVNANWEKNYILFAQTLKKKVRSDFLSQSR